MKDYMNNPKYSEFQVILDEEFEKANRKSVDDCFEETLDLIRGLARTLNDDDCYKYTEKLKKWLNKGGI
tara:strand:+ start:478 stop:684 length:207 start_codon:yes stop_codon:yes gene_type:complete